MTLPLAAAGGEAGIFLELGALALGLAVLARIGTAAGFSPIPLYLLGGLAAGLYEFELSDEFIRIGAQIGIVLLLFMLGLEYSAEELTASLRGGLPAGVLDGALNFTLGLLAGLALGWEFSAAFLLGGATYISSSGVIAKVLADLGRLGNRETPSVLSLLVIEDLAMAAYLPIATVLLAGGALLEGGATVAIALTAVLLILFVALRHGRRLSRLLATDSDEVLLLSLLGVVLLVAGVAEQLQVSAAVGAFLTGIAVSGPVVERARIQLSPLRDVFAATFFVFFGLQIDTGELPGVAIPALLLALATGLTKAFTGWWAARHAGAEPGGRARAATIFIARGEFSIVIAGLGVAAGAEAALGPLVAAYVLISAIAATVLTRFADRFVPRTQPRAYL